MGVYQVAVITASKEKYMGYIVGDNWWGDVEYFQVANVHHCRGRQFQGMVIIDNYTDEIMAAMVPTICSSGGVVEDMRPGEPVD